MKMTSTKRWLTLFSGVSYCENPVIGSCWENECQGDFLHLFTALKFLHSIPHRLLSFVEELEFLYPSNADATEPQVVGQMK